MSDHNDSITLSLQGDVPLVDFASAMQHLIGLLEALAEEIVGAAPVEWEIAHLQGGSATVTVRPLVSDPADGDRIIAGYMVVGSALQNNSPIPYSDDVIQHAQALTAYIDGKVKAVQFSSNGHVATVDTPRTLAETAEHPKRQHSLGIVTGVVETLSGRGRLSCTIYDSLFDMAIKCFIDVGFRETVRSAWGQRVSITGEIERDPQTGRPTVVRNVRRIDVQERRTHDSHQRARGVLGWRPDDESPEVKIRRMRNGE